MKRNNPRMDLSRMNEKIRIKQQVEVRLGMLSGLVGESKR